MFWPRSRRRREAQAGSQGRARGAPAEWGGWYGTARHVVSDRLARGDGARRGAGRLLRLLGLRLRDRRRRHHQSARCAASCCRSWTWTRDVDAFLGIPFAESTGGANRFQPPVPKAALPGVFDASTLGPACPQALNPPYGATSISEDCLTVNVWRPTGLAEGGRRPGHAVDLRRLVHQRREPVPGLPGRLHRGEAGRGRRRAQLPRSARSASTPAATGSTATTASWTSSSRCAGCATTSTASAATRTRSRCSARARARCRSGCTSCRSRRATGCSAPGSSRATRSASRTSRSRRRPPSRRCSSRRSAARDRGSSACRTCRSRPS